LLNITFLPERLIPTSFVTSNRNMNGLEFGGLWRVAARPPEAACTAIYWIVKGSVKGSDCTAPDTGSSTRMLTL
jgi:hypothetical protein